MTDFEIEKTNVGQGWQGILSQLHEDLLALDPDYELIQIKEKFGGLRYYTWFSANPEIHAAQDRLIGDAEAESYRTCENCGKPGQIRELPWVKTLCGNCLTVRMQ